MSLKDDIIADQAAIVAAQAALDAANIKLSADQKLLSEITNVQNQIVALTNNADVTLNAALADIAINNQTLFAQIKTLVNNH